jgi:uncharacterized protein YigA (DUF484 family)
MSEVTKEKVAQPELDEEEVALFLQRKPEFLDRHPEALQALELRHESGRAVSLIERQVVSLRRHNSKLQGHLTDLITTARDNELRVQHLNSLARALIAADSPDTLVEGLRLCLRRELAVDAIFIGIQNDAFEPTQRLQKLTAEGEAFKAVTNAFRRGKPVCGPLNAAQIAALFPDEGENAPQSAAMVPLGEGEVRGVLVLGSRDPKHFVPDMGTLFLELMGELVTTAIRRHVDSALL